LAFAHQKMPCFDRSSSLLPNKTRLFKICQLHRSWLIICVSGAAFRYHEVGCLDHS
jgi:hypothetical protein